MSPPPNRGSLPDSSELLADFLADWYDDRREGITLRSLKKAVDGHLKKDEDFQSEIQDTLSAFQTGVDRRVTILEANRERDAEDRAAGGTGRFGVVPPNYAFAQPYPPAPSAPTINMHVDSGTHGSGQGRDGRSRRPSSPPWWSREPMSTLVKYIGLILIGLLAGILGRHFTLTAPGPAANPVMPTIELPHTAAPSAHERPGQ